MTNFLHKASGTYASGATWSFGLVTAGSITEAAAETAWGGAVVAFFADTNVKALYSTGTVLTLTTTSTASSTFKQTTITRTTHSTAGTATTQTLPDEMALVVTWRTGFADKSAHGRWYLPTPVAAALGGTTDVKLGSTNATNIATALGTLVTSLTTAGLSPLLLTRRATQGGRAANTTRTITPPSDLCRTLQVQKRRGDKLVPLRTSITW